MRLFIFSKYLPLAIVCAAMVIGSGCASKTVGKGATPDSAGIPFPAIPGWNKSGLRLHYTPASLYDYINGAAESYLAYDFQELDVIEYVNDREASILVEVYRHAAPTLAFGIYSQERPRGGQFLPLGTQGYSESPFLNFLQDVYYVKINGIGDPEVNDQVLQTFAEAMTPVLGELTELPVVLHCFPEEGREPYSETFIAKNFMGYAYLHSGYTADYSAGDATFKLFIIDGQDAQACREMLSRYRQATGSSPDDLAEGPLTIADPFHGPIPLVWRGHYIWGALYLEDAQQADDYLSEMEALLRGRGLLPTD